MDWFIASSNKSRLLIYPLMVVLGDLIYRGLNYLNGPVIRRLNGGWCDLVLHVATNGKGTPI